MPTYEYECLKCSHRFEVFQRIEEPPRKRCPECKSKVRRLISGGAGLIFKGSGFYSTDYKKKPKPKDTCISCPKEAKKDTPGSKGSCPSDCPSSD